MYHLRLWLALGVVAVCQADVTCLGSEPLPSIEDVLARWEKASRDCRILDAELTVFDYDLLFGENRPEVTFGRFYFEAPGLGRFETRTKSGGATNDWADVADVVIWGEDDVLWVNGDRREYSKDSRAEVKSFFDQEVREQGAPLAWHAKFLRLVAAPLRGPQYALPLFVDVRAAEIREQYDLTMERHGEDILIKAKAKPDSMTPHDGEIDVLLDAKTYMVRALRITSLEGQTWTVYAIDNQKINQRPKDRDELMAPDLSGLREIGLLP